MSTEVITRYRQGVLPGRSLQSAIDEAMGAIAADGADLARLRLSREEFLTVPFEGREEGGILLGSRALQVMHDPLDVRADR